MRQRHPGLHKRGKDMSLGAMKKIAESFKYINFCGQMSDPIYHPKFLDILSICKNNIVEISTAGSGKKIEWWEEAALISSNQTWVFGIDGLPSQSNQYRIGQDGEQTFQMMKHISNIGAKVVWQMIVFKYNQDSIEKVRLMAKENNIDLLIIESSRWDIPYDKYKPDKHYKDRPSM